MTVRASNQLVGADGRSFKMAIPQMILNGKYSNQYDFLPFYSVAVLSFSFCHIMKNNYQDGVDDNKVMKKIL